MNYGLVTILGLFVVAMVAISFMFAKMMQE
jgi:hypothetical protein